MRVPFRHAAAHDPKQPAPLGEWTRALAIVGATLDRLGTPMRDLAIAWTGHEAWVTVSVWQGTRYHSAWSSLDLRIPIPRLTDPPTMPTSPESWNGRLRTLGQHLDALPGGVKDPVILALADGFAVTARTGFSDSVFASWEVERA